MLSDRSFPLRRLAISIACLLAVSARVGWTANEDIEFVTEHLAEAAMDNRYASLPAWGADPPGKSWNLHAQGAFARISVGGLSLEGPMVSIAIVRQLNTRWSVNAFAFADALQFSGNRDQRPLDPLFSNSIPLGLPAEALFTGLDGSARDAGTGFCIARQQETRVLREHRWIAGLLWQKVALRDYRFEYRLLSGPDEGASGSIDYSADYIHVAPFAGLELLRRRGNWSFSPHALVTFPLPRRGVQGCISGNGFALCGDTAAAGQGKHFGDPAFALGMRIGYDPWRLTFDLGGALAQALIEPLSHEGIAQDWLLSFDWRL